MLSTDANEMVRQEKMELEQTECILCGACVDTCPQGGIRYAWTEKKQQEQIPHLRNMSGKQ